MSIKINNSADEDVKKNSKLDLTVIIPCFKSSLTISYAVNSILLQTQLPERIIIVFDDDPEYHSTVQNLTNLCSVATDLGIAIDMRINYENRGPGYCRNLAWNWSTTKYIAFLDADDYWLPHKLEVQISLMEKLNLDLSCAKVTAVGDFDESVAKLDCFDFDQDNILFKKISINNLMLSNIIKTSSVILRTAIKQRFVETRRHVEDYPLWISVVSDKKFAAYINEILVYSRKRGFGVSGLSGDIYKMERAVQLSIAESYLQGNFNLMQACIAHVVAKIKFIRRLFYVFKDKALRFYLARSWY